MTETAPELAGRSLIRNVKVAGKRMQARLNVSEPCFLAIIQDVPILNQPASFCLQHIMGAATSWNFCCIVVTFLAWATFKIVPSQQNIFEMSLKSVWLLCIPFDVYAPARAQFVRETSLPLAQSFCFVFSFSDALRLCHSPELLQYRELERRVTDW